jgi:hypothetical protein
LHLVELIQNIIIITILFIMDFPEELVPFSQFFMGGLYSDEDDSEEDDDGLSSDEEEDMEDEDIADQAARFLDMGYPHNALGMPPPGTWLASKLSIHSMGHY